MGAVRDVAQHPQVLVAGGIIVIWYYSTIERNLPVCPDFGMRPRPGFDVGDFHVSGMATAFENSAFVVESP